jgi:hypothetical protein
VGETLSCAATATDADGDAVGLRTAWSTGATGPTLTLTASDDPGDTVTCTVTADDGDGGTATGSASATVINTSPTLSSVTVSPTAGRVGDTLTCAATAIDADGGSPSLSYAWSTGATGATTTLTAGDDPGDTVTCTVTADDGDGGTATGSAGATVLNSAPVIGSVSISPASATNDDTITCAAAATDADGGALSLRYAWSNATTGLPLSTGATLDLSTVGVFSLDAVVCEATATDLDGGSATATASLTVSNRAPTVSAALSPSAGATRSTALICTAAPADADGDSLSTTFSWTVSGATVAATSGAGLTSTLTGAFASGQMVACTATSSDGKGGSASSTASTVISNSPPVLGTVSLSPSAPFTNDTLSALVTGSDPDGDSLSYSYAWFVEGALVASGPGASLSGAAHFDRDDAVYVVVTVDDGTTTTTATSAVVTVQNTPPTAAAIAITPGDPAAGDALVCEVVSAASDVDGDALTYAFAWDVDGVAYTDATDGPADSVVDGADVAAGEVWTCSVVADDGAAVGAPTADDVEVGCIGGRDGSCPGLDCLQLLDENPGATDGVYWIDPFGDGAYPVVCDMTTDGGGWTLVMKAVNDNYQYVDPLWENNAVDNDADLDPVAPGKAKYQSFMDVGFTELRSSDPWTWSVGESYTSATPLSSAVDLFSGPGFIISSRSAYFNSRAAAPLRSWGCTALDRHGVNTYDVLGCRYERLDAFCDWNGGARLGNRVNGYFDPSGGNLVGQGWGAYYCGDSSNPSVDTGPVNWLGSIAISELLWVR